MGEYKWQGGAGSKGDSQVWEWKDTPTRPGVQEYVLKSLKIEGIGVIRAYAGGRKSLKLRGMLEAQCETDCAGGRRNRESLHGGFSSNQPSKT